MNDAVKTKSHVTRFAPSPTGRLHLGHAYSAIFAYRNAQTRGGRFILRIEDIDTIRCRAEFEEGIFEDLAWLGLSWETPVRRQSEHFEEYKKALQTLQSQDLLYPCFCTRKEIQEEVARADSAPHGPEGALYPGTCRHLSDDERAARIKNGDAYALRLDISKALSTLEAPLEWEDLDKGLQIATPEILGDVVLARKDTPASYHFCVTLDDHLQGVTLVTRGEDLFYATHLHRLLQHLMNLNVPQWRHHGLLLDDEGKRFAKRNQSVTIQHMREVQNLSPQEVIDKTGLSA
ncbi:MAG TPA: tRNA glutamyl-Q(34) synthetase GluQRS [Micavibrio sp.]|nr:tRNA glutamyl-Q(34) synthetase GluQRS [Micavibrio sp.]HIL29273.1 tRNA glutamyl-Q(34) synthetase GluQRS [Micavibrio sp.]